MKEEESDEIETTRTIGGTLGWPWLGASLNVEHVTRRMRDRRTERATQFVQSARGAAALTDEQARARWESNDDVAELTAHAGARAIESRDEPYRTRLSELVGAALADDANLDTAEYFVDLVTRLEPICIRALGIMADYSGSDVIAGNDDELLMFHAAGRIHVSKLADALGIDPDLAQSIIDRLCGFGLATIEPMSNETYIKIDRAFAEATPTGRALVTFGRTEQPEVDTDPTNEVHHLQR